MLLFKLKLTKEISSAIFMKMKSQSCEILSEVSSNTGDIRQYVYPPLINFFEINNGVLVRNVLF